MKINLKVLAELAPTYGVTAIDQAKGAKQAINSGMGEKAPAQYEPLLIGNGYEWSDEHNCYVMEDQAMYYFSSSKLFLWVWQDVLIRGIQSTPTLQKWVQGDDKYPQGKANSFMGIYKEMTGQEIGNGGTAVAPPDEEHNLDMDRGNSEPTQVSFTGTGNRAATVPEPTNKSEDDILIANAKKKMGKNGTLPSDDILDLYNKAKELKSNKLMTFIKTIKPLGEGFIKKSTLDEIVHQIVKTIIKEGTMDLVPGSNPPKYKPITPDEETRRINLNQVYKVADKAWGRKDWVMKANKDTKFGSVYQLKFDHPISRFLWFTKGGTWKILDPNTHKWIDVDTTPADENPSEQLTPTGGMEEETTTGAVAPITTPNAFKKKVTMEGVPEKEELKVAVRTLMNKDESKMTKEEARAILQRKGYSEDKISNIENPNELTTPLEEMTTTSGGGGSSAGTPGYNIPGAFSKKGGSEAGLKGAESLGYTLTGIGKKDMQRQADRLLSEGEEADAVTSMWDGSDDDLKAHGYTEPKSKKVNTQKKKTTPQKGGVAKVKGKVIHLDEGIVSGFVDLVKRAGLKLGIEMFKTPEEIQQANQIYSKIKEYLRSNKEGGKVPSRTEMESFFSGMIAGYNMPQDRQQIYWNALSTLRGHMIHRGGGIYGSR